MDLIGRVKKICLTPQAEWSVIAEESTPAAGLITQYVLPLAAVAAVAGLIGGSLVGQSLPFIGTYRVPLATGLGVAIFSVVTAVIGVFLISLIINALAPTFGAQKNSAQAFKVAAYSFTPAWVAGVFQILPALGILALLGALYGLYLLYLGLPRLMQCPADKAVGYTAVVVISAVVISLVLTLVGTRIAVGTMGAGGVAGIMGGAVGGGATPSSVAADPNSALGRLEKLGQALEESAKKGEAAAKSGDQAGQVAASLEGLSTLLGGGSRVDPLDVAMLKPLVPDTFAGLKKTSSNAEKTGIGIIMVSKAEATYGDGAEREVRLEITDTGGVSGLMGLASWTGVQEERESADGYSRTQNVNGRLTHMESSKSGDDEFAVVVGGRFMVSAKSSTLDVDALRAAVARLDLGKLEAMKDVGVVKK
ncbi:MAG TPA: Yip1 family protein [Vicinamibacterales bacterium]|nr:Yip1 family protein [Vicinamibacterales bacterium]